MSTSTSPYPDGIAARNVRERAAWRRHASPLSLLVFAGVVGLALTGVLGHERDWSADASGTSLEIHMPETIRNGEFLEMRISVESSDGIGLLVIGIDHAVWEDVTVNTMIPAATEETSGDGEFRFSFGRLEPGTPFLLKVDAQINPDIVGGNAGTITLYDGDEPLVEQEIEMAVLP
jgi:hypothetical protein